VLKYIHRRVRIAVTLKPTRRARVFPNPDRVLRDRRIVGAVLFEELEERPPCFAVLPGDLLTRCFAEDERVLVAQVGVLNISYVFTVSEVGLSVSVRDLIPQGGVGDQLLEHALSIPLISGLSGVLVRPL